MSEMRYLIPSLGGVWAISREVNGRWIALVERRYVDNEADIEVVFTAVNVTYNKVNLDRYFPKNKRGQRCPALEFLELFAKLGTRGSKESQIGV